MTKGGTYASRPCMTAEVDPVHFGPRPVLADLHRVGMTIALPVVETRAARQPRIYPQPHDIPLDLILTEDGVVATKPESRTDR